MPKPFSVKLSVLLYFLLCLILTIGVVSACRSGSEPQELTVVDASQPSDSNNSTSVIDDFLNELEQLENSTTPLEDLGALLQEFNNEDEIFGTADWTTFLSLGTEEHYFSSGIVVDSMANLYITGNLRPTSEEINFTSLSDVFIEKYDPVGNLIWSHKVPSTTNAPDPSIAIDQFDNIYVTGLNLMRMEPTGEPIPGVDIGFGSLFIAKYDREGTQLWQQHFEDWTDFEGATDIAVDQEGNVYITGYKRGSFDGNTHAGLADIFVLKLNSNGTPEWSQQLGTEEADFGSGITVDSIGNVYVTGKTDAGLDGNQFAGSGEFWSGDIFLVKYNSSGVKQWTQQFGTTDGDQGKDLIVDSSDNLYLLGEIGDGFDGNTSEGFGDILFMKFNNEGNRLWSRQFGSSRLDHAIAITIDTEDNLYLTGEGTNDLGGGSESGYGILFLTKYTKDGTQQWLQKLGSSSWDDSRGVATDQLRYVYLLGDSRALVNHYVSDADSRIFVAKYDTNEEM